MIKTYSFSEFKALKMQEQEMKKKYNWMVLHLCRHKKFYTAIYVLILSAIGSTARAETSVGGMRLIKLMQAASFWLGLGVSIWGVIEAQLDYPGWRGRVLKGVLGYIAILLLPLIFIELRDSLQVDVWEQIEKTNVDAIEGGQ